MQKDFRLSTGGSGPDARLCGLEKYQIIVCSIVFYFLSRPKTFFQGETVPWPGDFFSIPADTHGWISGC